MGAYENIYSTVGIKENYESGFSFYPNPVVNDFYITSSKTSTLRLINCFGQTLYTFEIVTGTNTFSLNHLSTGMYYLVDEKGNMKKLVKY